MGPYERWDETTGSTINAQQIAPHAVEEVDYIFFRTQEEAEAGARLLAAQQPSDTFMVAMVHTIVRTAPGELFMSTVTDRSILPR
jgi:hypothetical protein